MAGRMGILGDVVDAMRSRFRGAVDGVKDTIDDALDKDVATAGVNRFRSFFEQNAALRRKIGRG